ncbi:MAG: hypothetical protein ACRDQ5_19405 [Sciscionella sp.]
MTAVAISLGALTLAVALLRNSALENGASLIQAVRRRVSRFDRRYHEFVLTSRRFIDLKGLATIGHATPELDEVLST